MNPAAFSLRITSAQVTLEIVNLPLGFVNLYGRGLMPEQFEKRKAAAFLLHFRMPLPG